VQENGQWRRRYNFELYKLYDEPDLTKYIRINRLHWAGHVMRMSDDQITCQARRKKRNRKTENEMEG
jgi:hypothetical protein